MCGIIGIIHSEDVAEEIFLGLQNLQHRGQDGGGIVTSDSNGLYEQRGAGLLEIAFPPENFHRLKGDIGVGHTRYTTVGRCDQAMLQPFVDHKTGLAIAHNGNIVNFHSLRESIRQQEPDALPIGTDSEVILYLLSKELEKSDGSPEALFTGVKTVSETIAGSYSVVGLLKNHGLFAFRDPNGLRPLIMGNRTDSSTGKTIYAFASESMALEFLGYTNLQNINAGEVVFVTQNDQVIHHRYAKSVPHHCMFEWVYFARVESNLDSLPVYQARFNLGAQLAQEVKAQNLKPDIVVPVPETSRIAAVALAEQLNVPFREVLIKNRYVNRTFILESQSARLEAIRRKLYPIASELSGKKILIVDDSIVRGNTAIKMVELLRNAGAKEIYMASTCPPIRFPCYYGIDFPSQKELFAGKYSENELTAALGVDALVYQTMTGLKTALTDQPLCTACLDGHYPTDVSDGQAFTSQRTQEREVSIP